MSDKTIDITLTKSEWSDVNTWVESAKRTEFDRVSNVWFDKIQSEVTPLYLSLYFSDDNSAMEIPHDSEHTLKLNRELLRYLIVSVGLIAYNFDAKIITTKIAYNILRKLEDQSDEQWRNNRF